MTRKAAIFDCHKGTHPTFLDGTSHRSLRVLCAAALIGCLALVSGLSQAGTTTRVSVDSAGNQANNSSIDPAISADGRFVAFGSAAANLVPGDTNGLPDIFVHDRLTGETTRVSVDSAGNQANGSSDNPAISADGRLVAFRSSAKNLVPDDTNNTGDIFVHDRLTGQTTRVSVDSAGNQADRDSYNPEISADGRFVAFFSYATSLVPNDTNSTRDIFVHDRLTGQTTRVSVDSAGNQANGDSSIPAISADGRFVTFGSAAANLVPGDTNVSSYDLFVHDRLTGETTRVSVDSAGNQTEGYSYDPSISADGRLVAFRSSANNLVPGDTNGGDDIFVHDRLTGETTRVSVDSSGGQVNLSSDTPSLSADGRFVAFRSFANNLVLGDTNGSYDIFVHDRGAPTPETDPPVREDAQVLTPPPVAKNAIVITHGWNSNADTWVKEMAEAICADLPGTTMTGNNIRAPGNWDKLVKVCDSTNWDVYVRDWRSKAATGLTDPMQAYVNAISVGESVARMLRGVNYKHIHFIAHSAGSNLIHFATIWLKNWAQIDNIAGSTIHETFLDAYDPRIATSPYGWKADWADNYVDLRDVAPDPNALDGTKLFLTNAYTVNVTPAADGCGFPYITCRHGRPYRFYGVSIASDYVGDADHKLVDPVTGTAGMGYPLSVEKGHSLPGLNNALRKGGACTVDASSNVCVPGTSLPPSALSFFPGAIAETTVNAVNGTVDFIAGTGQAIFNSIKAGIAFVTPSARTQSTTAKVASVNTASVTTELPSWLTASVTTTEATNTLRFNWRFVSGGEGFVRIFVDDRLVREIDQRFVTETSLAPEEVYAGELAPGTHKLTVRLDGFGTNASGFEMTDVRLGKLVVEPDADADGAADVRDNCINHANASQRDTNNDGYGNVCDPDLNNDGVVNFADLAIMKTAFFTNNADADLNGDGVVNFGDLAVLKTFFFKAPGPSGVVP
ncbi:MAG: hypothetical protein Q7J84_16675 [Sulfuricaulis sp.]|nr:hypothetical protein [Sulfuricaulis sp.]